MSKYLDSKPRSIYIIIDNGTVPSEWTGKRKGGANPPQPRYCESYSSGIMPLD